MYYVFSHKRWEVIQLQTYLYFRADIVTIDEDTYRGLQIFSSVSHPSNFKKGVQGSNKEGLSLYHVFSKCSSKVGQSRMRYVSTSTFYQVPIRVRAVLDPNGIDSRNIAAILIILVCLTM